MKHWDIKFKVKFWWTIMVLSVCVYRFGSNYCEHNENVLSVQPVCLVDHCYHHQMYWPRILTCRSNNGKQVPFPLWNCSEVRKGNEEQEGLLKYGGVQNEAKVYSLSVRDVKVRNRDAVVNWHEIISFLETLIEW